ncbi:MAG: STAS domain-containing protein [Candidatus Cloacimonetes bacterium]|nr:STAS domain-containing protein [Candidatus Cloacimonadota bacterium]
MKVILEKAKEGVGLVKIVGRIDGSNEERFKKTFSSFLEEYNRFVFDCGELEYIDSSGLGAILSCLKNATKQDGDVYIANIQAKPRMLFEITRAYKIFEIFDDVQSAIDSFED